MTSKELYLQMSIKLTDVPPLSKRIQSLFNEYINTALINYINSRPRQEV